MFVRLRLARLVRCSNPAPEREALVRSELTKIEINAASTISSIAHSSLFDLKQTYFLIAGVAGVNPKISTIGVGSANHIFRLHFRTDGIVGCDICSLCYTSCIAI